MADLVAAVLETGNNGTLTLKLSCKRKGGVNQVVIEPKVTASIPDPTIAPRIMFADTSGTLHTDDPAQGKLDLDAPVKVTFPALLPPMLMPGCPPRYPSAPKSSNNPAIT